MVKLSGKERRQSIRAKRVLSIEFSLAKSIRKNTDRDEHLSTTEDMSLGGISFYTEYEYKKGDILDLRVVMSGVLDIFDGKAKVIRTIKKRGNYFLIGVEFLEKPKRSRGATHRSPSKIAARSISPTRTPCARWPSDSQQTRTSRPCSPSP